MDISAFDKIATTLLNGGAGALIVLLLGAILALVADRARVLKKLDSIEMTLIAEVGKRDAKLDAVTDSYFKTIMGITEALNGLKVVLAEINGRLLK